MEQIKRNSVKEILDEIPKPGPSCYSHQVLNIRHSTSHIRNADRELLVELFPKSIITTATIGDHTDGHFDVAVANLFLHESVIHGKPIKDEINKLMSIDFDYMVIIDYLDNPGIDWNYLDTCNVSEQNEFNQFTVDLPTAREFKKFKGEKLMVYVIHKIRE